MPAPFVLTDDAVEDLEQAAAFLAQQSEAAALNLADDLEHAFLFIASWPGCGRRRSDLTHDEDLRFWTSGDCLICYRFPSSPLLILAVIHGARDAASLIATRLKSR